MSRNRDRAVAAFERRTVVLDAADVVSGGDGAQRFKGHAAVFNSRTAIGNPLRWGFYEQIQPGAFSKTIQEADVRFLVNHDGLPMARTRNSTLRLSEDAVGLAVDADPADTSVWRDLAVLLARGDVSQMSFGFEVVKDDWQTETVETSDGMTAEFDVRTLLEVKLYDVSAVTFPAYEDTDAGLRAVRSARVSRARREADDADDDPSMLAASVDATIDQVMALVADADLESLPEPVAQAIQLLGAADASVDKLLDLMGVYDPDNDSTGVDDAGRSRHEPAEATRGSDPAEPARSTRSVAHMALRRQALAARYGLPA